MSSECHVKLLGKNMEWHFQGTYYSKPRVLLYGNLDPPVSYPCPSVSPFLPTFLDPDFVYLDASDGCFSVTWLLIFLIFPKTVTVPLKLCFVSLCLFCMFLFCFVMLCCHKGSSWKGIPQLRKTPPPNWCTGWRWSKHFPPCILSPAQCLSQQWKVKGVAGRHLPKQVLPLATVW